MLMNKKILLIGFIAIIIDQISKVIISMLLNVNEEVNLISNFFSLKYVHNTGAAFSIMEGQVLLFILVAFFALTLIIKYISSFNLNKRNIIAFGLLIGGICGNLLDRLFFGHVKDFLFFKIGNYNFPIFNLGDTAIFIGIIFLIIAVIKGEERENSSK